MIETANIFKALGNETRLRIFLMLKCKTLCVCEIQQIIGCSMATLSNHLKLLKDAGLINSDKENKYMNYSLNRENQIVLKLLDLIGEQNIKDKQLAHTVDRNIICGKKD